MDDKTDFIVYCIEEYRSAEKLSGKAVIELFNSYRVMRYLVMDFHQTEQERQISERVTLGESDAEALFTVFPMRLCAGRRDKSRGDGDCHSS